MTGETISHYRVLEKLGEGGMGVVYAAEDLRLKRRVALKFVPRRLLEEKESRVRFLREAQAAAALHHPNICTVFELDEESGFLAMELIAGPSLREKIRERPMKLDEALRLAIEIAEGLKAAHGRGVIHRDIKSANILIDADGRAKLTDFGLATLADSTRVTKTGTTVGTPGYLSPEQARGDKADRRTDLWALGVVLYEMISGQLPFAGESEAAVMHAVVNNEPEPVTAVRAGLPLDLDRTISRCLAKDPGERYQHVDDLLVDLRLLRGNSSTTARSVAAPPARHKRWRLAGAVLALLVAGGLIGGTLVKRWGSTARQPVRKYQLAFDFDAAGHVAGEKIAPVISPNGSMVAFAQAGKLYVQDLGQVLPRELAGASGAMNPFWSPDSRNIAYFSGNTLRRIPSSGGPSTAVGELPARVEVTAWLGSSWSRSGVIVAAFMSVGILEIPASGGVFKAFLTPDPQKGEFDFHNPHFLPDGQTLLFVLHPEGHRHFSLRARSGGTTLRILEEEGGSLEGPVFSSSGHLLYTRVKAGRSVFAVSFSPDKLRLTGRPFQVDERAADPSVSTDGTLLYKSGGWASGEQELVEVGMDGRVVRSLGQPHDQIVQPVFSPDGRRLAFTASDSGSIGLWVYDFARQSQFKLTGMTDNNGAAWSSAGDSLYVPQFRDGRQMVETVWVSAPQAPRKPIEVLPWEVDAMAASGDGRYLAMAVVPQGGNMGVHSDILLCSLTDGGSLRKLIATPARETAPAISPDGRFIAYVSDESGRDEVYVRRLPDAATAWPISSQGGFLPRWSRTGEELFFLEGNTFKVVSVTRSTEFGIARPRMLFDAAFSPFSLFFFTPHFSRYDVFPGRQSLVAVRYLSGSRSSVTITQNWLGQFK